MRIFDTLKVNKEDFIFHITKLQMSPELRRQLSQRYSFKMGFIHMGLMVPEFSKSYKFGCMFSFPLSPPQTRELHICIGPLCHIGSIFIWLPGNGASFGSIIRRSPRSTEERETVLLDQPAGQITAAGASDCKTLMDVRRVKPTSHLADRRQGRGRGNTNLCHV